MKKKIDWKMLIITVGVCLLPILVGIILYNKLPESMPVHFNINNEPDNYASKNFALFGLPLLMVVFQIVCYVCTGLKSAESEKSPKFIGIMIWWIPILTLVVSFVTITAGLGMEMDIRRIICFVLGVLLILAGNYMPKMSYETAKKITNPAPKDEKHFRKMTRVMSYTFVIIGMLFLLSLFFNKYFSVVAIVLFIVITIAESIYFSVTKGKKEGDNYEGEQ